MSKKTLWSGRFSEAPHGLARSFSASVDIDKALAMEDIRGSAAHVKMLAGRGIIPKKDAARIQKALSEVKAEIEKGGFPFRDEYEDIHMNIEKRVIEKAGPAGGMIHTARSRNDQVVLDERLYLKSQTALILDGIAVLCDRIVSLAEDCFGAVMPLYTHLQRAQPVLVSHHLLAYFEMLKRDRGRFEDCLKRMDSNPLGVCAGAGTSFPIDRKMTARLLGFSSVTENSIDTVSDRDFMTEFVFCSAALTGHLGRLSEELVLWSSEEFGFVDLGDAFTTGSSIMPQKRNPDIAELARAKGARVTGNLVSLLTLMKGLPLSYNRDMQEDKQPVFDTARTVAGTLAVMSEMLAGCRFNTGKMRESLSGGFVTATDLADYLARRGEPFRSAHEIAGKAVAHAEKKGKDISELPLSELRKFSGRIGEDVYDAVSIEGSVKSRNSQGGTAPSQVGRMLRKARRQISKWGC